MFKKKKKITSPSRQSYSSKNPGVDATVLMRAFIGLANVVWGSCEALAAEHLLLVYASSPQGALLDSYSEEPCSLIEWSIERYT